jgi:succinate-semialdehyde dehydrogenase/glutarate-semialdehyde dehydrogenase
MTALPLSVPGELRIGGGRADAGDRFEVRDPATADVLAEVHNGSEDDGRAAVDAAAGALPGWSATAPRARGEVLRRAFELMTERADALAELIVLENGKTLADATGEVTYAAEFFRWFSEEAVRVDGGLSAAPSGRNRILALRQPVGVSVLVTPWNFPAAMATRKIGPALAAGCTVVLKPASDTPLTALAVADLLAEAGVPDGVVNVVPARRSGPVVNAMLAHPATRKLSFTGSTQVGRILLAQAAERVLNCSMELGGNAPFVVFADADLDAAVEGAMVAKMRNAGESCIAANRFLVEASVADDFADRLARRMAGLRVGPGIDPDSEVGPMVNEGARDDIAKLVDGAVDGGAEVRAGAEVPDRRGWFYAPTVLADVAPGSEILGEEIFGPVAPIVPFTDTDEAVAAANDTEYGLAAYVYTGDLARGLRVSEAIDSGMVGLNRGFISDPAAPFGGVKQSGLGREGGHDGLLQFLETKYIAADW